MYRDIMVEMQHWLLALEEFYAPSNIKPTWKTWCWESYHGEETAPDMLEESWFMSGADVYLDDDPFPESLGSEVSINVCCMLVAGQTLSCTAVRGLILEPTGRVEGEYRRLGLFMTSHGVSMNALSVPHRSEEGISCEMYNSVTNEHTIVIV